MLQWSRNFPRSRLGLSLAGGDISQNMAALFLSLFFPLAMSFIMLLCLAILICNVKRERHRRRRPSYSRAVSDLRVAFWHSAFPPCRTRQRRRQVEIYPSAADSAPAGRLFRTRAPE